MSVRPASNDKRVAESTDELHPPSGLAVDGYNSSRTTTPHTHSQRQHPKSEKALKALETRTQSLQEQVAKQNQMILALNQNIRMLILIQRQQQQQQPLPPHPLHPMTLHNPEQPMTPFMPLRSELLYHQQPPNSEWSSQTLYDGRRPHPQPYPEAYQQQEPTSPDWPFMH